jgi:NADH:ubiquinone oxidoreductase subunit E
LIGVKRARQNPWKKKNKNRERSHLVRQERCGRARNRAPPWRSDATPTDIADIQEDFDWISPETARAVAAGLGVPVTLVDGVVQFYSFLYDKRQGCYRILFSDNITDRMLGNIRCSSIC